MKTHPTNSSDDFEHVKRLGFGKYAKVVLARKKVGIDEGKLFAMKMVRMHKGQHDDYLIRERNLLILCRDSPFIVRLFYAFQDVGSKFAYLVLELGMGGDLYELHEDVHLFKEVEARFYIAEMICGLEFLHNHNIIHRDLKGENILLTGDGHVLLCDLGLARQLPSDLSRANTYCGTVSYMSPEMAKRFKYGVKTDIWSLGILLAFLVTGDEPILGNSDDEKLTNISKGRYHLSCLAKLTYACRTLIGNMLRVCPDQRPSCTELKSRRFLNKLDWDLVALRGLEPPYKPRFDRKMPSATCSQRRSKRDSGFQFSTGKRAVPEGITGPLDGFDWVAPELQEKNEQMNDENHSVNSLCDCLVSDVVLAEEEASHATLHVVQR